MNDITNETVSEAVEEIKKEKKPRKAYVCTYCGQTGHNKRTCPKRKADEAAGSIAPPPTVPTVEG